ncbi:MULTISPECIES: LysR family transcriptional regulator [Delftia]|uniref:LysR family transcriptional regulator n=1 Tax=Delftia TaxID=80865 RepID=UPI000640358F|nr:MULTISPECIES: LysR family transcriptional regulator [Delftia]
MTPTSTAMHTLLHRAQTFLAVVDFGSYTRAADFLGISKAMASLHVKSLEEALSVALLVRNTRSIALTETGREFYDEFKGIVRDVGSAFDNAMHSGNRIAGRLRISTTSEYGEKYILPLIPAFLERYPGISVAYDVNSSLSDLVAEKLDLVVRLGHLADSSFKSRRLAGYDIVLVASAAFLRSHPVRRPEDLADLPWIANSNLTHPTAWTLRTAGGQGVDVVGRAAHQSNSSTAIRALARSSLGVAVLPAWFVEDDLADGVLQRVLPDHALPPQPISVVFPDSSHLPRKTRVFIDFLCEHLGRD